MEQSDAKPGQYLPLVTTAGGKHGDTRPTSRRRLWLAASLVLLFTLYVTKKHFYHCHGVRNWTINERAAEILSESPLIGMGNFSCVDSETMYQLSGADGHNDLAILIRLMYNNHIYEDSFVVPFTQGGTPGHVDLARLRAGKSGGAFWSVFAPCPENGTDYCDQNYAASVSLYFHIRIRHKRDNWPSIPGVQFTQHQVDLMNRLKSFFPSDLGNSATSEDALSDFYHEKLISPLGIEGLHQIGNSASNLRAFYDLGVRYATLTHNCGNIYADAALWENPLRKAPSVHGGVSDAGRLLIGEMNRIGMIVDISHTSEETQMDVLTGNANWPGSIAPPIFSHSSAYTLCPHPRNVQDHVLEMVKRRNSVVMVNFGPEFVSCFDTGAENGIPEFDPANSTLEHVVDHIMYIGNLIGFDYVGIGSDFDGIMSTPRGLEDVSKFPDLVAEILRRGVSDADVRKVLGGNVLRVWGEAEKTAEKLQKEGKMPLEDDLPHLKALQFLDV